MFMSKKLHQAIVDGLQSRIESLQGQLKDMRRTMDELEIAVTQERARTDAAVDRLLVREAGVPPIVSQRTPSLEDLSSLFEEVPDEVSKIRSAIADKGAESVLMGAE